MKILAIDPGPTESGWVLLAGDVVENCGVHDNHDLLRWVQAGQGADVLAVEMIANMGMAVGASTFDTVRWVGRYQQAWRAPESVRFVFRHQVKQHLCNSQRAKDPNIRQALIDLLGPAGTKKKPGPTYGLKSHAWAALAVAVTAQAQLEPRASLPGLFAPALEASAARETSDSDFFEGRAA